MMNELSRRITIGQYLPTGSVVHRMDPRYKIGAFVLLVLTAATTASIVGGVIVLCGALAVLAVARIPLGYALNGLRPTLPILIMMFVIQLLLYRVSPGDALWWHWGWFSLSAAGLRLVIASLLKFLSIILLISAFTLSTSLTEITRGVEQLLRPLSVFRFPAHEVALIVTITLRFVPTFVAEVERLYKAQAARGATIGTLKRWQVVRMVRSFLPLMIPLFTNALRRGEQLASAMEARGYVPGSPRTSYSVSTATRGDLLRLGVCLIFCVAIWLIPFPL